MTAKYCKGTVAPTAIPVEPAMAIRTASQMEVTVPLPTATPAAAAATEGLEASAVQGVTKCLT